MQLSITLSFGKTSSGNSASFFTSDLRGGEMNTIESYKSLAKELFHALHLSTYPVAIKFLKSVDEIPATAMRPSIFGKKMAICQAFTHARRWGTTVAITAEDNFCTPATAMHRWVDISMDEIIQSQVLQGWHKDIESEQRRFKAFADIMGNDFIADTKKYIGLVCAPANEVSFIPDSILIYCDGVQLTHIIQALSYEHKHVPTSMFEGFEESCIKGALMPFITRKPQVVIPGAGDRSFASISEHELGIGMPAFLLNYVMENLFKTGGFMNIGYPMKSMINMDLNEELTPGFKFLWDKFSDEKK